MGTPVHGVVVNVVVDEDKMLVDSFMVLRKHFIPDLEADCRYWWIVLDILTIWRI